MARGKKTKKVLTPEEKLELALVPAEEQPYPVPGNWCWVRVAAVSEFERGITFPSSAKEHEATEHNIPCLRTANIQDEIEIDDLLFVNKEFVKGNKAKLVHADDIIMSSANSRELVGKTAYVYSVPFPMTFGGFVLIIRAKLILSKYLFYFLRLEFLSGSFMGESTQTTNIANINTTKLGNYVLPLPPYAEQQRIVDRIESLFAKLDEAKEKVQAVLDSFETRKAAILHRAFSGELTGKWREKRGIGLESWIKCKLADVLVEKPRNGYSPKPVNYKTLYKSMTLSATTSGVFKREYFKYIDEIIPEDSYLWLQPGDILIQRANSLDKVGICAVYTGKQHEFIYPDLMMKLKITDTNDHAYIAYFLNSKQVRKYYMGNATGTAGNMPKINQKVVLETPIVLPSKDEQSEIVRILSNVFEKEQRTKEIGDSVLEQIEITKKSILAHAFRGELGTNNPSEESATVLLKDIL